VVQFNVLLIVFMLIFFCRDGRQLYDLLSKTTDVSYVKVNENNICGKTVKLLTLVECLCNYKPLL